MMLVNGTPAQHIPADDRGLAYGDGVFRTFRCVSGEPLHWARHYAKLAGDCGRLRIICPAENLLLAETRAVARAHPDTVVKIMVTRGSGKRGYAPPTEPVPTRIVVASDFAPASALAGEGGIKARLCDLRLAHQPALAGIKHLNRLENVLARGEWHDPEIREGLLLDHDGNAIGGTMSNLFIVESGALATPDLSRCGVAGVTRERVLEAAANLGLQCRIEPVPLQRVRDAAEVFFVNSLIGLWPVAALDAQRYSVGPVSRQIRDALNGGDASTV